MNRWKEAALLKDRTRRAIRERYQVGESIQDLAKDYQVPESCSSSAVSWLWTVVGVWHGASR